MKPPPKPPMLALNALVLLMMLGAVAFAGGEVGQPMSRWSKSWMVNVRPRSCAAMS